MWSSYEVHLENELIPCTYKEKSVKEKKPLGTAKDINPVNGKSHIDVWLHLWHVIYKIRKLQIKL